MDFDLSEEQRLLKESVERLLADRYGFEQRQAYGKSAEGWSRELWRSYAEMGLLGLPFAEEEGGFGGGPVETEHGWNEPPVGADWAGSIAPTYFNWRKVSIYGGSNEIQRNIITKAVLGL